MPVFKMCKKEQFTLLVSLPVVANHVLHGGRSVVPGEFQVSCFYGEFIFVCSRRSSFVPTGEVKIATCKRWNDLIPNNAPENVIKGLLVTDRMAKNMLSSFTIVLGLYVTGNKEVVHQELCVFVWLFVVGKSWQGMSDPKSGVRDSFEK